MQRESLIRGPAIVQWNNLTFYTQGDVNVTVGLESFDVESGQYGKVDERLKSRSATISFTPAGKWITGLWPYAALALGASIYGATDRDLVVLPLDTSQNKWTFFNTAITRLPTIRLSSQKTLIGDVEFTALGKEATLPGVADSLVKREANTFNDTSFHPGDLVTQPYTAAWGSVWTDIQTVSGWEVSFDLGLEDVISDTYGVVDKVLTSLAVRAKSEILNVSEAQLLTGLGADRALGASLGTGNDLSITGTGVSVTVKNAVLKRIEPKWGIKTNRIGEVEFVAQRKFATGAPQPLYVVA